MTRTQEKAPCSSGVDRSSFDALPPKPPTGKHVPMQQPQFDISEIAIEEVPGALSLFLVARWREWRVGVVMGDWEATGVLVIEDLRVEDDILLQRKGLFRREKRMSLSRRGIGRCLLKEVICQASRLGATELVGKLAERDLQPRPFLPDWYAREGFEILPAKTLDPPYIKGRIRMRLRPG